MKMPNNRMVRIDSALRAPKARHDNVIRIKIPQNQFASQTYFLPGISTKIFIFVWVEAPLILPRKKIEIIQAIGII
jgi:hypothetical protein